MEEKHPHFPLFLDLTGKSVVVVGGGAIAHRRVETLMAFGARVTVVTPEWRQAVVSGVDWKPRPYAIGDLEGAVLAVAATDSRAVNRAVGEEARARNIPVSVADCAEECTFFFPAVCRSGGLVAGVVGDGSDHKKTARAAQAIRACLEELI